METTIINRFQGVINNIEINNEQIYFTTEYALSLVKDKLKIKVNEELTSHFIQSLEKINEKVELFSFAEFEQDWSEFITSLDKNEPNLFDDKDYDLYFEEVMRFLKNEVSYNPLENGEKELREINKYDREETIDWLENNQNCGAFENQPEDSMDFNNLSDKDLEWYFDNWVMDEKQEESGFKKDKITRFIPKKISFSELIGLGKDKWKTVHVVMQQKAYPSALEEKERTFTTNSNEKVFDSNMAGYSMYGKAIDTNYWPVPRTRFQRLSPELVDYCYFDKEDLLQQEPSSQLEKLNGLKRDVKPSEVSEDKDIER